MDKQKVEFIESYIKVNGDYQWNDNHGELIRCKDCKHGKSTINAKGEIMVDCLMGDNWLKYPNWFCADGERK